MHPTQNTRKLLLVASTGGHLAELLRLHPMLDAADNSLWITFRTAQSETLLQGRRVFYVRYVRPRDIVSMVIVFFALLRMLFTEEFEGAVSTGAGLALATFAAARLRGIPTSYIESLGRVTGPSITGKILARLGRTTMYTQHPGLADDVWNVHENVLTRYRAVPRIVERDRPRLFVTLGTIEGYRFDALVDAVLATGLADEHTVWQLGDTARVGLPGTAYRHMSSDDYCDAVRSADVVISHAGVGSLLVLLEEGMFPILVTRRAHRKEHIDDHQVQMTDLVNSLGIAHVVEVPDVTADLICAVQAFAVVDDADPVPLSQPLAS